MNPNTKKLKDNHIKVSLDHYDHQIVKAWADKSGVEVAPMVRQLAMSKLHDIMFNDQPIAMILPSQNKVELPLSHFLGISQQLTNNHQSGQGAMA